MGSSQTRDQTQVSHIAGRFFVSWATKEAPGAWWADWKSKHCHFEVLSSFILCNKGIISWSDCDVWWKVDFIQWLAMTTNLIAELRRSSKALPKAKLPPKRGHGQHLVVCYWCDPLQLSESQWNHHIWEVGSANQWDTLKTAMPAASTGKQKEPNSSLQQCLHNHTLHNQCFKSWTNWATKFCLCSIHLTSRQPTAKILQASWQLFCREKTYTTSKKQKILFKSLSNPKV